VDASLKSDEGVDRDALVALFARTSGGYKFGLERTRALLAVLGDPHLAHPVFHVGGTNGKGSTVATLEALLAAGGHRVARYTSPHLVDFRERMVASGKPVPPAYIGAWIQRWLPTIEDIGASFFEATTAMAFDWFSREPVDVVIAEVGLGGRLDSTNVVQPVVAGVTSIGWDHTEYLGNTLEQIALEKAGIFKPGAPAVIGEQDPHIRALLADAATRQRCSDVRVVADRARISNIAVGGDGTRFVLDGPRGRQRLRTPLAGRHQADNVALALEMLDAAGTHWSAPPDVGMALAGVRLPGRFHREGDWIFDVAHNVDGARVLAQTVAAVAPRAPITALVCVLGDKDWQGMLAALATVVSRFILTNAPTAPASRRWSLEEAHRAAELLGVPVDADADFDAALARARSFGGTTLVTGSFHTVGDAMARLQVRPLPG